MVPAQAQTFPNSSLDAWETRSGTESPVNWFGTDDIYQFFYNKRIASGTVTKTMVTHGGPFAAQLQTKQLGSGVIEGIIALGTSFEGAGGVPFTARPTNLQFYYQLSGPQAVADSARMELQLSRQVNGKATLIGGAIYYFSTPATDYTLLTVPVQYLSELAPDSMSVSFFSGSGKTYTTGTTLLVDDISFTGGTITATHDAVAEAALSVFPNPSLDGRYVLSSTEPSLLAAPLTVLDATGRVVRREAAPARPAATRVLDLSGLPGGLYSVQLFTARGPVTRKLSR